MQLLHVLVNLSDHLARDAQAWEVEKKAEIDVQIAWVKIKELNAEAKHLQGVLRQVEFDLVLALKKEKEAERRTEDLIQDAKHSSLEEFKASPTFVEKMAWAIEIVKASEEYCDSHVAFSKKIFH